MEEPVQKGTLKLEMTLKKSNAVEALAVLPGEKVARVGEMIWISDGGNISKIGHEKITDAAFDRKSNRVIVSTTESRLIATSIGEFEKPQDFAIDVKFKRITSIAIDHTAPRAASPCLRPGLKAHCCAALERWQAALHS